MTQEEKDIVLHGAKFEMMNRCIDFNDGTVDREKMLNAMQRYAEMYHDNELSKLRQHDVSVSVCNFVLHNSDIVTNLKCRECGSSVSQY